LHGGEECYAFEFESNDAWEALRAWNKDLGDMRMACCDSAVVLQRSPLGTKYFAHANAGTCQPVHETEEYLLAKMAVAKAVRKAEWTAKPEQQG
jgi:competence protein CoiA